MSLLTDTRDALAVENRVHSDYRRMFGEKGQDFVSQAFAWARDCFTGRLPNYLPIDARYHDFEHTLQGTLCLSTLLRGRAEAGEKPALDGEHFGLGLLAILLHDTGYLKRRGDREGTGAKYTLTHVSRSCEFAEEFLRQKGYPDARIKAIQNMICCTGVEAEPTSIQFRSELERIIGFALGSADLLGQMAAPDYVEKLPILFEEFVEAARFAGKSVMASTFSSAEELMSKTPAFWENFARPRLERDFRGLYRFLAEPPRHKSRQQVREPWAPQRRSISVVSGESNSRF